MPSIVCDPGPPVPPAALGDNLGMNLKNAVALVTGGSQADLPPGTKHDSAL